MFSDELGSNPAQTKGIMAKAQPRMRNTDAISAGDEWMQYTSEIEGSSKELADAAAGGDDSEGFLSLIYMTRPWILPARGSIRDTCPPTGESRVA